MKHYLRLNRNIFIIICSCLFFLFSCNPILPKYTLPTNKETNSSLALVVPQFSTLKYTCVINGKYGIKKYGLSGILVLKKMDNHSTRAVFQNEMGLTYFDFEWDINDSFFVHSIIDKMNQPALIKSLQKDFEILLFKNEIKKENKEIYSNANQQYIKYDIQKGCAIFDVTNDSIKNINVVNNNKVYITFQPKNSYPLGALPDEMNIVHHKANYTIHLKKIDNEPIIE